MPQKSQHKIKISAEEAMRELWGNALFDCGPEDYELMMNEILETYEEKRMLQKSKLESLINRHEERLQS